MDSIRIKQRIEIEAPIEALFGLIRDPQRYVAIEPRLQSARWLDESAPRPGAMAEIVTDMPFTLPVVRKLIPSPRGVITLTDWRPPNHLTCRFDGATVVGELDLSIQDGSGATILYLNGTLTPRARSVRWLLRPMRRRLEELTARSVQRGAERLELGLHGASEMGGT